MFVICVFAFERKKFDSAIISNLLDVFVELERLLNQHAVESCIASLRFPNDNIIKHCYDALQENRATSYNLKLTWRNSGEKEIYAINLSLNSISSTNWKPWGVNRL